MHPETHMPAADQIEYRQLISTLADRLPHGCVNPRVEDVPLLSNKDIPLICRMEVDVMDHLVGELDINADADAIAQADFCHLGTRYALALERACRRAICYALLREIESREREAQLDDYEWVREPLEAEAL
jgi:hypothetical protein